MMTEKMRIIAQQQALIHKLAWNDGFGCHTRAGFEHMVWPEIAARARWIICFDIDGMHALNQSFGSQEPVDAMIKQVLASVRSTDYVAGQWKSGDEFLICITETDQRPAPDQQAAEGLILRLVQEFAKHSMSATYALVPVRSTNLVENVQPGIDQVYELKGQRDRKAGR